METLLAAVIYLVASVVGVHPASQRATARDEILVALDR